MTPEIEDLIKKNNSKKVYVSKYSFPTPGDLGKVMDSVNIGIAFYQPIPGSISLGNNLKYLGMSSGKIATYLQHGIPIIINEIGLMSECTRIFGLGYVVHDPWEISSLIQTFNAVDYQENCLKFFDNYLNLDHKVIPLIDKIKSIAENDI